MGCKACCKILGVVAATTTCSILPNYYNERRFQKHVLNQDRLQTVFKSPHTQERKGSTPKPQNTTILSHPLLQTPFSSATLVPQPGTTQGHHTLILLMLPRVLSMRVSLRADIAAVCVMLPGMSWEMLPLRESLRTFCVQACLRTGGMAG